METITTVSQISLVHLKDAYVSEFGKEQGYEPQYGLQIAIDKRGTVHEQLKAAAKNLGVAPNTETLRYSDGDEVTLNNGEKPYAGKWLINLHSRYRVPIVDKNGNDMTLTSEPWSGTVANVAFRVGCRKDKTRLVYFLAGVQILDLKQPEGAEGYKFGAYIPDDDPELEF